MQPLEGHWNQISWIGFARKKVALVTIVLLRSAANLNLDSSLVDLLRLAALLKEMVVLTENGQDVLNKISFKDIPESQTRYVHRLFQPAVTMGKSDDKDYDGDDLTKFKTMSINTLRRKLCDKGLDIDGTRAMCNVSYCS